MLISSKVLQIDIEHSNQEENNRETRRETCRNAT